MKDEEENPDEWEFKTLSKIQQASLLAISFLTDSQEPPFVHKCAYFANSLRRNLRTFI